jgi:RHS repeat-associated protein
MFDDPSTRETRVRPLVRASVSSASSSRSHWGWRVGSSLLLTLVLLMNVLANMPVAQAKSHAPTKLPIPAATNTLQQFLKQGHPYKSFDGIHVAPASQPKLTHGSNTGAVSKPVTPLPSAEPPTMKAASAVIPASYVSAATSSYIPSSVTTATVATPALHLIGSDSAGVRMELNIPAGALDFSAAKTATGAAIKGPVTVTLTQTRGYYFTATLDLATYQISMTDATGAAVKGVGLRAPIQYLFHYRKSEVSDLGIDPSRLYLRWESAPIATGTTTSSRSTGNTNNNVILATNTTALILSATSTTLVPLATVSDGTSAIENPPKARFATVQGNSGQLTYSYPIAVAPGPNGTTPQLALSYSSGTTNARHAPTSPSGPAGDGWSLSMGEITSEQVMTSSNNATLYSLSDVDGVSDRLLPNSSNGTSGTLDYQTEHPSYFRIKRVDPASNSVTGQHYFLVWDKDGNEYEFGNTLDSLAYYYNSSGTRINYDYALDKVWLANNGSLTRTITVTYVQDKETGSINSTSYTWIRDFALKRITYSTTANGNTTLAGTVDFFYNGPSSYTDSSNSVQYVTQYTSAYETACGGTTNGQRCDDPLDKTVNGTEYKDPDVMSTLELTGIKSYVGSDTSGSLDYSYALTYTDTAFSACSSFLSDSSTISNYNCAGDHLLTRIVPTVYQNGTGSALPGIVFGYSGLLENRYNDSSQSYEMQNKWNYLNSYTDLSNGVGITGVTWHKAWNNSNGTPYSSGDKDNRYDALYCEWHSTDCNSGTFYPYDNKMWTEQVVTKIVSQGKDSSASSLSTVTTNYNYWLTKTSGSCTADSQGNSDCVGFGWMNNAADSSTYANYYNGEFRGFGTVLITNSSGNLMVQKYATTYGWGSAMTDARNYLSGSLLEEDTFSGTTVTCSQLLTQTLNNYAGEAVQTPTCGSSPFSSTVTSCNGTYIWPGSLNANLTVYTACEPVLLSTRTINWEGTGTAGPYVEHDDTYDDYSTSTAGLGSYYASPATGSYHNLQKEVISGSNIPTTTKKWTYDTTNTTVSGTVYYDVDKVAHSEVDDSSSTGGTVYACQDTTYDEGVASGVPQPAAGWPTTTTTYSKCGDSSTSIKTYTGYDTDGNAVATVDGVGVANPSLYSSNGCTLSPAPTYLSASWTAGRYTSCTTYSAANARPLTVTNALRQASTTTYDATQGLLPTSVVDVNNQTTSTAYSYSAGNTTVKITDPGESGAYTKLGTQISTCTTSSTTPCLELDNQSQLYSSAPTRVYYDSMGRKVETLTSGPDASHTTVTFTVYNDSAHTVFTSQPFVIAVRTTWLDPNGATDYNGVTPGGTTVALDALNRTISSTDALSVVTTASYNYGSSGVSGDSNSYAITTVIDGNLHEGQTDTDALGRTIYAVAYSGLSTGTLTAVKRTTTAYNVLDKPISVVVTDLAPQANQTITSVTTTATYDSLGRLVTLADPDRGAHTYTYDANGKVTSDTVGSRVIGTSYDLLGRVGCVQNAKLSTITGNGACDSSASPYQVNTYDADPSGVSWSSYPVGKVTQSVSYTYYPAPDSATGTVTENYQYDQRGKIVTALMNLTVSGGSNVVFPTFPTYKETQTYNDAEQPVTTTTSTGSTTDYTFTQIYDSTTGVSTGLTNGTTTLAGLSYNSRDLVSALTLNDSTGSSLATEALVYDGDLRPASATTTWTSGGSTIYSDGVSYDAVGNVTSRATTQSAVSGVTGSGGSEVQNFCYDESNQLVWASNVATGTASSGQTCGTTAASGQLGSSYTNSYVYTHLGQQWQAPLNGSGTQEQYLYCNSSAPHQLTTLSAVSGSPTCTTQGTPDYSASYDAYGNVVSRAISSSTGVPVYNVQDQMIRWSSTTASASNEEWYLYDATGNRVLRRSASTTTGGNPAISAATITVYAFGLEEHVYSYSGSGNSASTIGNTYYYRLNGRLIGTLSGTSTLSTTFLLADLLGSIVSAISNTAGSSAVLGNQIYGPYGNIRYSAGSIGTAKGFTAQYTDDLTGFDYYSARYYDPVAGRFLSADSVQSNLKGYDPYTYVLGNPETKSDPTGYEACDAACITTIVGGTGAAGIELGPADLALMGIVLVGVLIWNASQSAGQATADDSGIITAPASSVAPGVAGGITSGWQQPKFWDKADEQDNLVPALAADAAALRLSTIQKWNRTKAGPNPHGSNAAAMLLSIWDGKSWQHLPMAALGYKNQGGDDHAEQLLINWAQGILAKRAAKGTPMLWVNAIIATQTNVCPTYCSPKLDNDIWLQDLFKATGGKAGMLSLSVWQGNADVNIDGAPLLWQLRYFGWINAHGSGHFR